MEGRSGEGDSLVIVARGLCFKGWPFLCFVGGKFGPMALSPLGLGSKKCTAKSWRDRMKRLSTSVVI